MNRPSAVQFFSLLAILAGAAVSYFPPPSNAAAIWALVSGFLGYGVRDLFPPTSPPPPPAAMPSNNGQGGFVNLGMILLLAVVSAGAMALSGCATTGSARQTPQQVLTQVCPAAQITVASLSALRGLSTEAHDDLAAAAPVVDAVCAAGATVDLASMRTLSETAIPALIKITDAAPLTPSVHDQIILGLTVGQIVLAGAMQAATQVVP